MDQKEYIEAFVQKAREAQREYEKFTQEQVDAVVKAIARSVWENATELARMAVDETKMGVFEDKVKKNQGKARIIWNSLKDKKSMGIIGINQETGVVEIAKPMGVVGAVTPCTNPIVTPMCNVMFSLKCKNAIIISPHPRAKRCARKLVELFNQAIREFAVPDNLIQVIEEPSPELSSELMKAVDVVVATGGMGMVKSAYSSGKPAYGVGAGNVQCIIDRGVDIKEAVPKIITGRNFDNGIICSAEQTVIVPQEDYERIVNEFKANGAYYIENESERKRLKDALFPNGEVNRNLVGKSAQTVADTIGITIPKTAKLILVKVDSRDKRDLLRREKMCPVLAIITYQEFNEAVDIAQNNLDIEGRGHSVSIHSNNRENIEYAAGRLTVSRVLINQICATMNGGSFFNGFAPTTTLGCGTWGNNIISENLDYKHLMNITRIGYFLKEATEPTDAELWG